MHSAIFTRQAMLKTHGTICAVADGGSNMTVGLTGLY
jgi:hypothetical protein